MIQQLLENDPRLRHQEFGHQTSRSEKRPLRRSFADLVSALWAAIKAHPFLICSFAITIAGGLFINLGVIGREHCVEQANAFLHGHIDIRSHCDELNDLAKHNGRYYIVNPPLPSLLMVPFVALFGHDHTKCLVLTTLLVILNVFQLRSLSVRYGQGDRAIWLALAALLGTGYWYSHARSDGMWFIAHIVSFTCLLGAINEGSGRARGWLLGVFLGASFLSRQATIYSGVFLALTLWFRSEPLGLRTKRLMAFAAAFGVSLAFYLWFNWMRFDNPFDTGYNYLTQPEHLDLRQHGSGLFHWSYIPSNAIQMFLSGFTIDFYGKDMLQGWGMSRWGTSLTFASPFVFFAFFSKLPPKIKVAAWISIALTLLHILSYHANGWVQINCYRYTLDFIPLLLLLCITAVRAENQRIWKAAVIYSVALNALALVFLPLSNILWHKTVPSELKPQLMQRYEKVFNK